MLCGVTQMIFVCKLQKNHLGNTPNPNIKQIYLLFISWCYEIYILYNCSKTHYGPQHVLWQVSFGCWVMWSISSCVFFPHAEWWVAELLFLSLNIWGLNFLQNECSQSSHEKNWEKLRKMFTLQSWRTKLTKTSIFAKLPSAK